MVKVLRHSPFEFCSKTKKVSDPQLTYVELVSELKLLHSTELVMFVRAYVQERTPAAFSTQPMLWEAVREWVAARLQIHPREFGLSGSAQSGFALARDKRGVPFNPQASDLDMFIVNERIYLEMEKEARLFSIRNSETGIFTAQAATVTNQLRMGYLDLNQIPANYDLYRSVANARNDASILIDRLSLHGFKLKPSHFRIYRNWTKLGEWVHKSYSSL